MLCVYVLCVCINSNMCVCINNEEEVMNLRESGEDIKGIGG